MVWGCKDGMEFQEFHKLGKIRGAGPQTPLGCGSSCGPLTQQWMWTKSSGTEEKVLSGMARHLQGRRRRVRIRIKISEKWLSFNS